MINSLITFSLNNRFLIIILSLIISGLGFRALFKLNLDAFPDITSIQVQINAVAPALTPLEIEQQLTFPIEREIGGLPGLVNVRSISKFGFCQIIATFNDETDMILARQLVGEKLQQIRLPSGIKPPSLGPISTGLGEVLHYLVRSNRHTLKELTTIQDWIIKPRLKTVSGVAEVNTWGGKKKQYQVVLDENQLIKYALNPRDVSKALEDNNLNVGGGGLSQSGEYQLIQGVGIATSISEIENILVEYRNKIPIYVRDLASVRSGYEIRRGGVSEGGIQEVVLGLGFMLKGENSYTVTQKLHSKLIQIERDLPEGVTIDVLYLRTDLIDSVIHTVKENLLVGALLVIAILFWFLGSLRAGLIVALAIPFSMLFASIEMVQFGIAGSLLSLGAIDFGLLVDSSVIVVENSLRKLSESEDSQDIREVIREAAVEVRQPTLFGELIILIVFLPILALEGVEGKLFVPMALTMIFALLGSLLMSLTLTPVLASILLPKVKQNKETFLMRVAKILYEPVLNLALSQKSLFVTVAFILVILGGSLATRLGNEFVPRLYEGSIVINTVRLAGVSLEESLRYGKRIEAKLIQSFPHEIKRVWTRTGTAQTATDPMGLELSDVYIVLKDRSDWRLANTQYELTDLIQKSLEAFPGMRMVFTQPIEMRVNEMNAGIRADLGVKIFGDSLDVLTQKASEAEEIIKQISGVSDLYVEQIIGQGVLNFDVNREALARYGVSAKEVLIYIEALGEVHSGEIREGQKRFDLVIRFEDEYRRNPEKILNLPILTKSNKLLQLKDLLVVNQTEGPSTITREWQKRRITIQCNARNRDLGGFVKEVQSKLKAQLNLPDGYHLGYGGQYENLQRAKNRLKLIIPLALGLILCLLFISTRSLVDSLIIFSGAPFAALGGVVLLYLRQMPFTISAAVGFVAVSGVAMLNGLVLMSTIRQNLTKTENVKNAVYQGAMTRLRPVIMTALVAAVGFVPMALNTGIGAEVQRPLATVVLGGVFSDCILTLCILPSLTMFGIRR